MALTIRLSCITKACNRLFKLRCFSSVDYTYKNYPVNRNEKYSKVTSADLSFFENLLPGRVITNPQELEPYNIDWLYTVRGMSPVMLRPKTTEEVSAVVKYCNEKMLAICPQGGNTGFVGGSVPVFDEVILSLPLMNEIREIDPIAGFAVCQSGVILEHLDNTLAEKGLMVPLDLGAKGSCHIGGNISTNAGGLRYLRYGSLHGSVLGLEAVLADGTILDCLSTLKKDNTGYDLKQLFIGSEGTLGIVTTVSLATPYRPKSVNVSFFGVESYDAVKNAYMKAKSMLGEILSAFEFIDYACMDSVQQNLNLKNPIGANYPFYVLVETSGSNEEHDTEKLHAFLETVMDEGIAADGTVASDTAKVLEIWKVRESVADALSKDGQGFFTYDISLPVDALYQITDILRQEVGDRATRVTGFGHFGDGNIHLVVMTETYDKDVKDKIEPIIFNYTSKHGGSISAEHGVGLQKANRIHYSRSPDAINLMKKLKLMMDPKGILNPYKMLPS